METERKDSVYDDADLTADVAGNGVVLPAGSKGIAPPPPKTKMFTKKGMGVVALAAGGIASLIVLATAQTPTAESAVGSGKAEASEPGVTAAAAVPQMAKVQENIQREAGVPTAPAPNSESTPPASQGVATPANAAPPSPREQFKEWLEKHHYDRVRARYLSEDQAYTAKLLDDTSGSSRAQPRIAGPQFGMSNMPAAQASTPQAVAAARERVREADESVIQAIVQRELDARRPPREAPLVAPSQPRDDGYLAESVRDARDGHEIAAGTIIPAVLLSAINSDLPGSIVAQVRQPVYSTFHYQQLLIPAGTRILGRYSSQINYGQERVMVAWDELVFPNGKRINLGGMSGTDAQGAAGLRDKVDTHFWRTWGNALLISLIGVAAQQSQPENQGAFNTPSASQQAAAAAANSLNETASQVLRKNLNVAPTLEIRPGYLFNILVNKSVSLPPYRED